jgi:hypothetical protein
MSNEVKAVSFRLSEEDVQKFREFAEEQGLNQAEMFQAMMNNFEMAKAKGLIIDRAKEIETFQDTVNTLVGMFVNSLAINQTSEERIRETLSLELGSKDKTIADLQEREMALKSKLDTAHKELDKCTEQLHRSLISGEKQDKEIAEKDKAIASYQSQINMLNETVAECRIFRDGYKDLEVQNAELSKQLSEIQIMNTNLLAQNNNLEDMKSFYTKQIDSLRDEVRAGKKLLQVHESDLNELRVEHAEELNKVRQELEAKYKAEFDEKAEFERSKCALELEKAAHREQMLKDQVTELEKKNKAATPKKTKTVNAPK